jgi:3-isopropylmalate/(R)-2-methylmalate dehydratase small subunit
MNWLFGDNINTDLITPGRYNITTDPAELAKIVFIEYRPEFCQHAKEGDFIIAGNNFGCGSSRETAATALKARGIEAIIARSYARIFYRNCLNQGLLAVIADMEGTDPDDTLELRLEEGVIVNQTKQKTIQASVPQVMITLNKAGGIIPYIQQNGLDSFHKLFDGEA